jgi:hypothetical protein
MRGKNCYRGAPALDQKALHDRNGVHPDVDEDAFMAVGGAN